MPEEGIAMYGAGGRKELAAAGADAIELTGTSLTFYKGEAFNQRY